MQDSNRPTRSTMPSEERASVVLYRSGERSGLPDTMMEWRGLFFLHCFQCCFNFAASLLVVSSLEMIDYPQTRPSSHFSSSFGRWVPQHGGYIDHLCIFAIFLWVQFHYFLVDISKLLVYSSSLGGCFETSNYAQFISNLTALLDEQRSRSPPLMLRISDEYLQHYA